MRGLYEADSYCLHLPTAEAVLPVRSLFKAVLQRIDRLSLVISHPELA